MTNKQVAILAGLSLPVLYVLCIGGTIVIADLHSPSSVLYAAVSQPLVPVASGDTMAPATPTPTPTCPPTWTPTPVLSPTATATRVLPWATPARVPPRASLIETITIGRSVKGQSINATRIGTGSRIVVVSGAIHGSEANTAALVESLAAQFNRTSGLLPIDLCLYFVPRLNPDGLNRGSRYNANRVDLNRNWDTNDWQPNVAGPSGMARGAGGPAPFSEPETAAFSAWLLDLDKQSTNQLVALIYHSAYPPSGLVQPSYRSTDHRHEIDPEAAALAQRFAARVGYPSSRPWTNYAITGEAIHWCADHSITCLTIELPSHDNLNDSQIQDHASAIMDMVWP